MFWSKLHVCHRSPRVHQTCSLNPMTFRVIVLCSALVCIRPGDLFPNGCCSIEGTGRDDLAKFRMRPCNFPHWSEVWLPWSCAIPFLARLIVIPNLKSLLCHKLRFESTVRLNNQRLHLLTVTDSSWNMTCTLLIHNCLSSSKMRMNFQSQWI